MAADDDNDNDKQSEFISTTLCVFLCFSCFSRCLTYIAIYDSDRVKYKIHKFKSLRVSNLQQHSFKVNNQGMLISFPSDAVLTLVEMVAASPDLEGIKALSTLTPSTLASTLQ